MLTLDKRSDAKVIEVLELTAHEGEEREDGIIDPILNTLIWRNTLMDFTITATGLEQRMYLTAIMYGYKVIDNAKYLVKVPHTEADYYYKAPTGLGTVYKGTVYKVTLDSALSTDLFTLDEIKEYGLEDYERIEFNGKVVQ